MLGGIWQPAARRVERFNRNFTVQHDSTSSELNTFSKVVESTVEEADICIDLQAVLPVQAQAVTQTSAEALLKDLKATEADIHKDRLRRHEEHKARMSHLEETYRTKFNEQAKQQMDEFRDRQTQAPEALQPETTGKRESPELTSKQGTAQIKVLDAHIHFADRSTFKYSWWESARLPSRDWTEEDYRKACSACSGIKVESALFVEVAVDGGSDSGLKEAVWALNMAAAPESILQGVVAYVPVPEGAAAVKAYLAKLTSAMGGGEEMKSESGSNATSSSPPPLPKHLKGGRAVLAGSPPSACMEPIFIEGLKELHASGLPFDVCIKPPALPHFLHLAQSCPQVMFILDHLGKPEGDFDGWKDSITALSQCPNVVLKLSGVEEWDVGAPAEHYLEHALTTFGADRCMFASNWFVSAGFRFPYSRMVNLVRKALENIGADESQISAVFYETARRVYRLNAQNDVSEAQSLSG